MSASRPGHELDGRLLLFDRTSGRNVLLENESQRAVMLTLTKQLNATEAGTSSTKLRILWLRRLAQLRLLQKAAIVVLGP